MQVKSVFTLMFVSLIVLIGSFLFVFWSRIHVLESDKRLSLNDVRGIDVYFENKPYTLNFKQQICFINDLYRLEKMDKNIKFKPSKYPEKIIIHRFDGLAPIEVFFEGTFDDRLVFKINNYEDDEEYYIGGYQNYMEKVLAECSPKKLCLSI